MAVIRTLSVALKATTAGFERGMRNAQKSLSRFRRSALNVGGALAGRAGIGGGIGGVGLALGLQQAVQSFASFEQSIAKVGVLLDGGLRGSLRGMTQDVERLSRRLGLPVEELASGLFDIVSAGTEASKATQVLASAANLARAGFSSTATTADALTTILNAYRMSADEAGVVSDKLFQIQKLGKTDLDRVAGSIGNVAATASLAGLNLEELGAALTTITAQGIGTEEAVTAINALLRVFLKTGPESAKAAKDFGIELSTATLRTEGLVSVLEKLQGASAEQIAVIAQEARAIKGLAALTQNLTRFQEDLGKIGDSTGIVHEKLAEVMDLTSTKIAKSRESWAEYTRELGFSAVPAIDALGKALVFTSKSIAAPVGRSIRDFGRNVGLSLAGDELFRTLQSKTGIEKQIFETQLTPFRTPENVGRSLSHGDIQAGLIARNAEILSRENALGIMLRRQQITFDQMLELMREQNRLAQAPVLN